MLQYRSKERVWVDLGSGWSGSGCCCKAILCSKFSKIIATILFAFNLVHCSAPDPAFITRYTESQELKNILAYCFNTKLLFYFFVVIITSLSKIVWLSIDFVFNTFWLHFSNKLFGYHISKLAFISLVRREEVIKILISNS